MSIGGNVMFITLVVAELFGHDCVGPGMSLMVQAQGLTGFVSAWFTGKLPQRILTVISTYPSTLCHLHR